MPVSTKKVTARTDRLLAASAKIIAKNVAKRAAKAESLHARRSERAKAVAKNRKAAKTPTPAGLKPIAQEAAAEARSFVAKLDAKDRADAKAARKAVGAGKAPAATTKPAKSAKAPSAKPVTLAKAIAANGGKPTAEETKAGPLVTGAKATIIGLIDTTKGGVSAAEIAKKLGWPRAGGTISRAIKLAPFKIAKARDGEGVLRYSRAG